MPTSTGSAHSATVTSSHRVGGATASRSTSHQASATAASPTTAASTQGTSAAWGSPSRSARPGRAPTRVAATASSADPPSPR
ncbi:hypothetical protein ACFQX7_05710 [Luedemannella flava]